MPLIKVRDIEIYYEIAGQGPRLLYISGTGADLRNKPNIFDSVLADEFEILAFDQRGLGQTSRPDISYTMADYAEDATALLENLGWQHCHVMGVSFGGMVAQELAIRFPQSIERLVLCCSSSGGEGGHSYPFHELSSLTPEDMNAALVSINDTRHNDKWQQDNVGLYEAILDLSNSRNAGAGESNREIGARRQLEARIDHNTFDRLSQIKIPVLIACGQFDGVAPLSNQKAIQNQLKEARLEIFQGGHDFYDDDPNAYERIGQFLKE